MSTQTASTGQSAGLRERRSIAALKPEDVFMAWLISLPRGTDVACAAKAEIARIDRAASTHAGLSRLRDLLAQAAALQPGRAVLAAQ
ncbi:hypothetical protein [Mesorhizobium sp. CAU 1741]|uniref:hypothetical protein n=1 Tax=Mesorhizobium sp. CAU 1741 TaxID=3140366 RepID=UPI00325B0EC3